MRFYWALFLLSCLSSALAAQTANSTIPVSSQNQQSIGTSENVQDPPFALPAPPKPSQQNPSNDEKALQKKEQSQRILGVMPQFTVTSRHDAAPLTTGQKFRLFVKGTFDPFQYATAGFSAGLGQATNEFPEYGQGAAGYGKRFGAAIADQVSSSFFGGFVYPVLFKQDPRYFRLGEGSIKRRVLYSLAQGFVCRRDGGGRTFNWSNVLGVFTGGAISNAYYPTSDRGVGLTINRSVNTLVYDAAGNLLDEFWTDIHDKFLHKHSGKH
ncbi:MAG TPA: hypothetical protein VJA94_24030 [Candidatus Angelobacter sp.]